MSSVRSTRSRKTYTQSNQQNTSRTNIQATARGKDEKASSKKIQPATLQPTTLLDQLQPDSFVSKRTRNPPQTFSPQSALPSCTRRKSSKKAQDSKSKTADTDKHHIPKQLLSKDTCPCAIHILEKTPWIDCDQCEQWWHKSCTGYSDAAFDFLASHKAAPFICIFCQARNLSSARIKSTLTSQLNDNRPAQKTAIDVDTSSQPTHKDSPTQLKTSHSSSQHISTNSPEDLTKENSDLENIVIIDGIENPKRYGDSKQILKEIKSHKPNLSVDYAYRLPRAGIALHCKTSSDKSEALKQWPDQAFGSNNIKAHTTADKKKSVLIIRNIPRNITDSDLAHHIESSSGEKPSIRRFKNRRTNQLMPLAELNFSTYCPNIVDKLLKEGLQIGSRKLPCEPRRTARVLRCYNCQQFGHVAKVCNNQKVCVDCAQPTSDDTDHHCTIKRCTNCGSKPGNNHSSVSKTCPQYLLTARNIAARKQNEDSSTQHQKF